MEFPSQISNSTLEGREKADFSQIDQVHYIQCNGEEMVLGETNDFNTTNLILEDGSKALFVNGTLVTSEGQMLILQDGNDFSQYSGEDNTDEVIISKEQEEEFLQILAANSSNEDYVQYASNIDLSNNGFLINTEDGDQQMFYIQDSQALLPASEQYEMAELDIYDTNVQTQVSEEFLGQFEGVMDLEQLLLSQQAMTNTSNNVQYGVLRDGKIHLQLLDHPLDLSGVIGEEYTGNSYVDSSSVERSSEQTYDNFIDLTEIKGHNIKTGQVITLSRALDKKVNSVATKNTAKSSFNNLKKLINRKIELGQTDTGKKLVGKIVNVMEKADIENRNFLKSVRQSSQISARKNSHNPTTLTHNCLSVKPRTYSVSKNCNSVAPTIAALANNTPVVEAVNNDNEPLGDISVEPENTLTAASDRSKIIIQNKKVSKGCFDTISKTMAGLMNMDSVMRKLRNKIVIIKIVEKTFNHIKHWYEKAVSFCSGYMVREFKLEDDSFSEQWQFIPDNNSKETIFGRENSHINERINEIEHEQLNFKKYASLTIEITINEEGKRTTRVIVNPPALFQCKICTKNFRTSTLLKVHSLECHSQKGITKTELVEGPNGVTSTEEKGLYECVECKRRFNTPARIAKHMADHFKASDGLTVKTKQKNEGNQTTSGPEADRKIFSCHVCARQFSRYSNLQRHTEIHEGEEAMYQCSICNCSYRYISSLTRHVLSCHREKEHFSETIIEDSDIVPLD
ncbi:uncharacterized protein [Euwallacea similis]|uniref:uncharacterized protein isoform X1 n=1 Tax=Euwallacea similis TaxID=1736056 RepID=UPI0034505ABC